MGRKNQGVRLGLVFVLMLAVLLPSCATIQDVRVVYEIPDPSKALEGKRVFIDFQDHRQDRGLLGPGAQKEFTYHSGNVDLYVSHGSDPTLPMGSKDIPSMFREVFAKRIQNLGGEVVDRQADGDVAFGVSLLTFSLDLKERTWIARMTYEAWVGLNGKVTARQSMTGEAERVKILGLKQAHQVMSDLFTDVVNRLDIQGLIQKGGL